MCPPRRHAPPVRSRRCRNAPMRSAETEAPHTCGSRTPSACESRIRSGSRLLPRLRPASLHRCSPISRSLRSAAIVASSLFTDIPFAQVSFHRRFVAFHRNPARSGQDGLRPRSAAFHRNPARSGQDGLRPRSTAFHRNPARSGQDGLRPRSVAFHRNPARSGQDGLRPRSVAFHRNPVGSGSGQLTEPDFPRNLMIPISTIP